MTVYSGSSGTASVCVMRVEASRFAIGTSAIREVLQGIQPQTVPLAARAIAGLVAYRGEVLTIVSMRALLGLNMMERRASILVMEDPVTGEPFGLEVDEVEGVLTLQQSALEPNPCTLDARCSELFAGVYPSSYGLLARIEPHRVTPSRISEQEDEEEEGRTKEC